MKDGGCGGDVRNAGEKKRDEKIKERGRGVTSKRF